MLTIKKDAPRVASFFIDFREQRKFCNHTSLFTPKKKKNYKAGVEARDCLELRAAFASSLSSA